MPRLVLLRHAQAEPSDGDDHARHLTGRGRADAAAVVVPAPDLAVVSTATRTRETFALLGLTCEVRYDERVYDAIAGDLQALLAETPGGVKTLLLVGHDPSLSQLAGRRLGTADVAVLELDSWG